MTNYYYWHAITITIFVQAGCYFWAALPGENIDLAVLATILAFGFLVWNVALNLWLKPKPSAAPQWIFWVPVLMLGVAGLIWNYIAV